MKSLDVSPQSHKNKVCIIIPTFNSADTTLKIIKILKEQTLVPDIIVIDGGSTMRDYLTIMRVYPDVQVYRFDEDLGGAGSYHHGVKIAYEKGYDYIILSDNDAIPLQRDVVEILVKYASQNRKYGIVTIRSAYMPPAKEEISEIISWPFHFYLIRRDVVEKVGAPIKAFFFQSDDYEYSLRILHAGYKNICINSRLKKHPLWGIFSLPVRKRCYSYYSWRNSLYVYKKYNIPVVMTILKPLIYTWFLALLTENLQPIMIINLALRDFLHDRYGKRPLRNIKLYKLLDGKALPRGTLFIGQYEVYNGCKMEYGIKWIRVDDRSYRKILADLHKLRNKHAVFLRKFFLMPLFKNAYIYAIKGCVIRVSTGILKLLYIPFAIVFGFLHSIYISLRIRSKKIPKLE